MEDHENRTDPELEALVYNSSHEGMEEATEIYDMTLSEDTD